MRALRVLLPLLLAFGFAASVWAQPVNPLSVVSMRQHGEGATRVFAFELANAGDATVVTRGRLVIIDVYAASQPTSLPIRDVAVPAQGTAGLSVRWDGAPPAGQVRALLVLTGDAHPSLVEGYSFWIFPVRSAALFGGAAALAVAVALGLLRLRRRRGRTPSAMTVHLAEAGDTVVGLAGRFDVSWQDIVRANRLKPPYSLAPGQRVLIPRHALRRPGTAAKP